MTGKRGPPSTGKKTKVLRRVPSRIGTMVWKARAPVAVSAIWSMGPLLNPQILDRVPGEGRDPFLNRSGAGPVGPRLRGELGLYFAGYRSAQPSSSRPP